MLASVSLVAVRVCPVLADPRTALSGYVNCSMTPSDEVNDENVPAQFGDATPPSRSDQAENRLVTTTESGREVRDSRPTKMSKRRVCVQGLSSTRPNNSVSTPLIQLVPLHTNAPADGTASDTVVIRTYADCVRAAAARDQEPTDATSNPHPKDSRSSHHSPTTSKKRVCESTLPK